MTATTITQSLDESTQKVVVVHPFVTKRQELEKLIDLFISVTKTYAEYAGQAHHAEEMGYRGHEDCQHRALLAQLTEIDLVKIGRQLVEFDVIFPDSVQRRINSFGSLIDSSPRRFGDLAHSALHLSLELKRMIMRLKESEQARPNFKGFTVNEYYAELYGDNK